MHGPIYRWHRLDRPFFESYCIALRQSSHREPVVFSFSFLTVNLHVVVLIVCVPSKKRKASSLERESSQFACSMDSAMPNLSELGEYGTTIRNRSRTFAAQNLEGT